MGCRQGGVPAHEQQPQDVVSILALVEAFRSEVVACIREISDSRRFNLIEALAAAIADTLVERFDVSRVRVRVRKPEVQLDAPAAYTAATIEREHR